MPNFIKNLQDKPYETRLKIMWGLVAGCTLLLISIFVWNTKSVIQNVSTDDILNPPDRNAAGQSGLNLLSVEKIETRTGQFRIYFNLNNPTDDILNMALIEDITLSVDGADYKPEQITDRQGQPFVAKVLSKTQAFGVLIFPTIIGAQGSLEFDRMYFEKSPEKLLSEKLELEFNKLKNNNPIRD